MTAAHRLGRGTAAMLALAGCWSAILIVGVFFVPAYQSAGRASAGNGAIRVPAGHQNPAPPTLAAADPYVVAVLAVPLLMVLVAGIALWLSSRRTGVVIAWTAAGILVVLSVLGLMSVGIFVLPSALMLVIACGTHRPGHAAGSS